MIEIKVDARLQKVDAAFNTPLLWVLRDIVSSTARRPGIDEPSVSPLALAVANANGAATGKYPGRLPFRAEDLRV